MRLPGYLRILLLIPLVATGRARVPFDDGWRTLLLPRTELAPETNALNRWQSVFPRLVPADDRVIDLLNLEASPLAGSDVDSEPLSSWLESARPLLDQLRLQPGESLQLPPFNGPETPFPDHQPLRQLALVRNAAMHAAWRKQAYAEALALALDNLALSRALLTSQEGLIPAINAGGVWQVSLDGVYWLARQADLTPAHAATLQAALLSNRRLAVTALVRAFRGEFTFFTRIVVDRLPRTHDPELLLSGIGSLGMAPPLYPQAGEPRLGISEHNPFDREATLQASADDVRGWIDTLIATGRHPQTLTRTHTHARLQSYAHELPALVSYAISDSPSSAQQLAAADREIATVDNPVGKLFLIITTSQWEPISIHLFKREAERAALTALLAWRRLGRPAPWDELVADGLLTAAPADPFSNGPLHVDLKNPRVWSVGPNALDDGGEGTGENNGRPPDLVWPAR
jgi:hypothetical protein